MPVVISLYQPPGFDLSGLSYDNLSFDFTLQETLPRGLFLRDDGTRMYICGEDGDSVFQYDLGTAWDVSSAVYNSVALDVSSKEIKPSGVVFKPNGLELYISGGFTAKAFQYTMSTAWDVGSATFTGESTFDFNPPVGNPTGLAIDPTGTQLYLIDTVDDLIYQYTMSVAWDITTVVASLNTLDVSEMASASGISFNTDGTRVFVTGFSNNVVFQYDLGTAWDITSGVYNGVSIDVSNESLQSHDVQFKTDGKTMYILDDTTNTVFQYSV